MQATITAVILTKNEEKNIADCLSSLSWCDEIIIIDDFSADKTVAIAQKYKAKVFTNTLDGDFSAQRNFGLEKASGEWVLFIDADERVSLPLHYEILHTVTNGMEPYSAYYLKRFDVLWGKKLKYGETAGLNLLRLAKKHAGLWHGKVHETWVVKGKISFMKNSIDHYPHPSISEFLQEVNTYTDLRAQELYEKRGSVNRLSIIAYPLGKFMHNYIYKQGFRDGIEGAILAIMMSFHSFLARGKLWQLGQIKEEKN